MVLIIGRKIPIGEPQVYRLISLIQVMLCGVENHVSIGYNVSVHILIG